MTVASDFYNWQASGLDPKRPPYNVCAPALLSLNNYLRSKWGGQYLGCHNDRDIRGGTATSSHAYGAALDWRYKRPGIGRRRMLREVLPFLIEHSAELGVQAIHDYYGSRIWRANRANDENGGWRDQPKSAQMGQKWATYLHIEVNRDQWGDGRTVEEKINGDKPVVWPPFDPARGKFGLYPLNPNKAWLHMNARGDLVKYLQGVLKKNGYRCKVDGDFGPQTRAQLLKFQRANKLTPDGVVGPKTWAKIDQASR